MISSISKTDQLKEIIIRDIRRGTYKCGDTLPSIQMFCRKYGVSKHTVSQALSNLSELGLIDTAPGKLTRISNKLARKVVDIVYVGQESIEHQEFWSEIYHGIISGLKDYTDIDCRIRPLVVDHNNPEAHVDPVNTHGVLLLGVSSYEWLDYLRIHEFPAIMVYDRLPYEDMSFVSVDYSEVMERIVSLFVKQGRSRLAYINRFPLNDKPNINLDKFIKFRDTMKKHGLEVDETRFHHSCENLKDAYDATIKMINSPSRPDGIFLASDTIAQGVYRALYDNGLKIPDDIAIAGCDNLELGSYMTPSLTSIELSRHEAGRRAAVALAEKLNNPDDSQIVQEYISPKIVVRESLK